MPPRVVAHLACNPKPELLYRFLRLRVEAVPGQHPAALDRAEAKVDEVARQVAGHVYEVLWSAEGALADVAYFARSGCTPDLIREFRTKAAALYAMRGVGYVTADGLLACTSFGKLEPPVRMRDMVSEFLRRAPTASAAGARG